jgi:DNA-binding NarL/FixJ family response regulator
MALVGAGMSNEEIAGQQFVSPATAKTHVSRAMVKLGRAGSRLARGSPTRPAGLPGWTS